MLISLKAGGKHERQQWGRWKTCWWQAENRRKQPVCPAPASLFEASNDFCGNTAIYHSNTAKQKYKHTEIQQYSKRSRINTERAQTIKKMSRKETRALRKKKYALFSGSGVENTDHMTDLDIWQFLQSLHKNIHIPHLVDCHLVP